MKCVKCGNELEKNAKFCVNCGTNIENKQEKKANSDFVVAILTCLLFILNVILKPMTTIKEKIKNYSDIKSAGILVGIIALGRTIINLLGTMINAIFVKNIFKDKLEIHFEYLKNLNYFDLLIKETIGFIIIIMGVAGIYYIVSLIMKKTCSYLKLTSITAVSFVPFIIVAGLISVIINYIYAPISFFITIGAFVYSLLTFIGACNEEIKIDDSNLKIYFHSICLTVIFIVFYYITLGSLNNSFLSLLK